MIKRLFFTGFSILLLACSTVKDQTPVLDFIQINGPDLMLKGEKFFIKGTNLGNWLNPEGYMFGFRKTNSAGWIDRMFCQLAGPDFTAEFWSQFKDRYITREDIDFIASTGANTIRLPFHYKLLQMKITWALPPVRMDLRE